MPHEAKKALRRHCRARRRALTADARDALDAALIARIKALPAFEGATALIAYWPVGEEINLTPLFADALRAGIPVYLPRTEADGMHFYRFEGREALTPDRFGIPSPTGALLPADTKGMLCLLPGLAADKNGYRLGYGGGFYDKFLCTYQGFAVFPLYDCFLFDTIPHEAHDRRVPLLITEKGEYRYGELDTPAPRV